MHQENVVDVELVLIAPILTHSSSAGRIGVDAAMAKTNEGRCVLPFSLIKGRLRQSWDELSLAGSDAWFGRREGGWSGTRGGFRFSDFVEKRSGEEAARNREIHRIQIDAKSGAADEMMLQFIESPFAAGERVTFTGTVSWYGERESREKEIAALTRAFQWTTQFGALRSIGFGRVATVNVELKPGNADARSSPEVLKADRCTMRIEVLDPFCLAKKRVDDNTFESEERISGAVIRGILATTLNRIIGRASSHPIQHGDGKGSGFEALANHLNEIVIGHAFPSRDGTQRPVVPPLSVVSAGGQFCDISSFDGPILIDGKAPDFAVDWKDEVRDRLSGKFPWPRFPRTMRTRTAIDRKSGKAMEGRLFTYEMIEPAGTVWLGTADFSRVTEEKAEVISQFGQLFATGIAALGKTKARIRIELQSAGSVEEAKSEPPWYVTLQTPALLCDPSLLHEGSGRGDLFAAYESAWKDLSNDRLKLRRFFATQSLAGGYLVHRFRSGSPYAPFLLTDAGSVFVLDGDPGALSFLNGGNVLPLPSWARTAYGDTWDRNPFLPVDGFGEISFNATSVVEPPVRYRDIAWTAFDEEPRNAAAPQEPGSASGVREKRIEELEIGSVSSVVFSNRWVFEGVIETQTNFRLGSGLPTDHPDLTVKEENESRPIEIAAVAVDAHDRAYIPGSSLKGALRAWAKDRFDAKLVESVFGEPNRKNDGSPDDTDSHSGKAEFLDAAYIEMSGSLAGVPYWRKSRCTGVIAAAAIDRWSRTVEEKKLFHFEYVPAGVRVAIKISASALTDAEAGMLLQCLRAFGTADSAACDFDRVCLGADVLAGFGRFLWIADRESVHCLNRLERWKSPQDNGSKLDIPARNRIVKEVERHSAQAAAISIGVELAFDGPFLVNEPARTSKEKGDGRPNHTPRVDTHGRVHLPASSLRGAVRAQAERIARTVGVFACHSTRADEACVPAPSDAGHPSDGKSDGLCITCRLFGSVGRASRIRIAEPRMTNAAAIQSHEFVAIDRFTGGVAGGAKFSAEAAWRPSFLVNVRVDRGDLTDREVGLFALALRDLSDGDIPLGFGRSKGFGGCRAKIDWLTSDEARRCVDAFHDTLSSLNEIPAATAGIKVSSPAPLAPATSEKSPDGFHNPYQFVPIGEPIGSIDRTLMSAESRLARSSDGPQRHLTHDRYAPGTYSGRIICKVTSEGPLFIGDRRTERCKLPALVTRFERDGSPYIPATTLRGLLSSLAEAASSSAMRVLDDAALSVRDENGRKPIGSVFEYFRSAFGDEILPYNVDRKKISLAEQLFGYVEHVPKGKKASADGTGAFASRLRFSFARGSGGKEVRGTTRVLSSPRPSSLVMYMQPRTGQGAVRKSWVAVDTAKPLGRKMYLHQDAAKGLSWKTQSSSAQNQKNEITALSDAHFWFHADFDNLSRQELSLLCFALRPSDRFRHKIGMGKSIGLGTIQIDPAAVLLIDRVRRYSEEACSVRYHTADVLLDGIWVDHADDMERVPKEHSTTRFAMLRDEHRSIMDPDILRAIDLLGDPGYIQYAVQTPQLPHRNAEEETYRWFADNEKASEIQYLQPINASTSELPYLHHGRRPRPLANEPPPRERSNARAPQNAAGVIRDSNADRIRDARKEAPPNQPVSPPGRRPTPYVTLELDETARLVIARDPNSGLVIASEAVESMRQGIPAAVLQLRDGAKVRGRVIIRREGAADRILVFTPDATE